jgi:hypothetical protein
LYDLLEWLYKHHAQVLHSLAGLEELLLIGGEIEFLERSIHNHCGIHQTYSQLSEGNLPMVERLQTIGKRIKDALKDYNQPMPLEFAIKIMARVMPKLDTAVVESMPLNTWTRQLTGLGLIEIRDKLEADVTKVLASGQAGPPVKFTSGDAVSAWMNNEPIGDPRSELGNDGQHIVDQHQASFDQEPRVASPLNSLFTDAEPTPVQKACPTSGQLPADFKLALPPGGIYEGCTPTKTKPYDLTEFKRQFGMNQKAAERAAAQLTGNLHRARTLSVAGSATQATPAVSESSRFTGHATPAARPALGIPTIYQPAGNRPRAQRQGWANVFMAEKAAETSARLRGARGQGTKGAKTQILSPMPSVLEHPAQLSVKPSVTSVVDDDGDSKMEDEEDEPVQPSVQPSAVDHDEHSKLGDEEDDDEDNDEESEDDGAEEGEEEGCWIAPESRPTSEDES